MNITHRPVVADPRNPGAAPMKALAVKLQSNDHHRLQQQAQLMGVHRSALARTLLTNGLDQLEAG